MRLEMWVKELHVAWLKSYNVPQLIYTVKEA